MLPGGEVSLWHAPPLKECRLLFRVIRHLPCGAGVYVLTGVGWLGVGQALGEETAG